MTLSNKLLLLTQLLIIFYAYTCLLINCYYYSNLNIIYYWVVAKYDFAAQYCHVKILSI